MSKLLMLDNYDSFTHNLVRYFRELEQEVQVERNDALTVADIRAMKPDGIVISPGPCTPNEAGICLQVIQELAGEIPMLGVCLGHQAIGQAFGAKVVRAQDVMHGKTSVIRHNQSPIFAGTPDSFSVVRYHSLVLAADSLPACLEATAWVDQAGLAPEIMALQHKNLAIFGVQFHPESVLSEHGHQVLANFLNIVNSRLLNQLVTPNQQQCEQLPQRAS
ncbi:MAG: aminodeoxychorismate/anthranilate synthase component II [Aliidiomarina sp.]|uniref:anthranilate synthase component II n=1 Tax=Aliidiomarina sp. TaxID=1872439 RepID=UPI0025B96195|nr:aminodeoxychorismate/anthranilate synthase component II [Aliidiomarina sp.]MCH8502566.1 aminodeoxychorismate/anthranilate synthase component II [Aliidiomarina sp.]